MNEHFELYVDLQNTLDATDIPEQCAIELWLRLALQEVLYVEQQSLSGEYELTIRIVERAEITQLNKDYRHQDKPTNVLSFPYEAFPIPSVVTIPLLGDIVICHDIVVKEAQQQGKSIQAHWAHMVIHGLLHLKGYDHMNKKDALIMEKLEVKILKKLDITDPYQ